MFKNKLIIGDVGIESPNEIIAVAEGVGYSGIPLASVRVRIAYPIHPMAGPAFSKVRAFEKLIDKNVSRFAQIFSRCRFERLLLFDCGRKPGDGKGQSS